MSLARLAVRSAKEGSGSGAELDDGGTFGDVLTGLAAGFVGTLWRNFCAAAVDFTFTLSPVCEAHIDATAVTLPPRPPRADRISYFTSGSGVGGKAGKRGDALEDIISALFPGELDAGGWFFALRFRVLEGGDTMRST